MHGILAPVSAPHSSVVPEPNDSIPPIDWNGAPFHPLFPPVRKTVVVRTAAAAPRFHIASALPAELIQIREHRIELVSDTITLFLITNAPEAATELPDSVQTTRREIGTYYAAQATWRGRSDVAFVSASLTDARIAASIAAARAQPRATRNSLATYVALAGDVLRAGLIFENQDFAAGLSQDEILLANLLMKLQDPQSRAIYSLDAIGAALEVSGETIRRRQKEIAAKSPALGRIIAAVRACNNKGDNAPPSSDGDDGTPHAD